MRRPGDIGEGNPGFSIWSVGLALSLHGVILAVLFLISAPLINAEPPDAISIIMVPMAEEKTAAMDAVPANIIPAEKIRPMPSETNPMPAPKVEPEIKPESRPEPQSEPQPELLPEPENLPVVEQPPLSPQPSQSRTAVDILQSEELTTAPGSGMPPKTHIPSRWALKPPLAEKRLEGLGFTQDDIECLTSLEDHCQKLRKRVFAEYRLTETELVWTPNRPDTGMTSEFRGLSEQEILEKLGMNYAGGNAFMILPGISIDGPLWDKLHGVNKTCKLRQNYGNVLDGTAGTVAPRRVCD